MMATYYINPDHTNNGDGTGTADQTGAGGAFNTWYGITFGTDDTYLGAGGTTWVSGTAALTLNTADNVTFNTYGEGRHIMDGAAVTESVVLGTTGSSYFNIRNFHIKSPFVGDGSNGHCISTGNKCSVDNCIFEGQQTDTSLVSHGMALATLEFPFSITNNEIFNTTVGMACTFQTDYLSDENSVISGNYVHDIYTDGTQSLQEAIKLAREDGQNGALCNTGYKLIIENNRVSEFLNTAINLGWGLGEVSVRNNEIGPCISTQVEANNTGVMAGVTDPLENANSAHKIYGNYFHHLQHYDSTTSTTVAVNTRASFNCEVYNNIFYKVDTVWWAWNAGATGWKIFNNVIDDCAGANFVGEVFGLHDADAGVEWSNNIYKNITATYIYIAASGTTTSISNESYDETPPSLDVDVTDLGGHIIGDPLLNSDYSLQKESPCIGTGTTPLSERDFNGKYRESLSNDIGAIWFDAHDDSTEELVRLASGAIR